ncbi:hypothetical protein EVAR_50241_1 [Eumeta japonica]|uniref:Uncharacterized protein n=1 Tax=Eumeta variegata TaxID=151549 RepID=A0A4C1YHB6_EUMVA|nr:hypothetical protein EVAR_50241_1 [Eumeta japonica]
MRMTATLRYDLTRNSPDAIVTPQTNLLRAGPRSLVARRPRAAGRPSALLGRKRKRTKNIKLDNSNASCCRCVLSGSTAVSDRSHRYDFNVRDRRLIVSSDAWSERFG